MNMKMETDHANRTSVGRSGFSLIEVMVATMVFAVVMTSVLSTMIMAQRVGQLARSRLEALHVARAQMEELYSGSYFASALSLGDHTFVWEDFDGGYTVTEVVANELKRIELYVEFPFFERTARVELEGRISRALH